MLATTRQDIDWINSAPLRSSLARVDADVQSSEIALAISAESCGSWRIQASCKWRTYSANPQYFALLTITGRSCAIASSGAMPKLSPSVG